LGLIKTKLTPRQTIF